MFSHFVAGIRMHNVRCLFDRELSLRYNARPWELQIRILKCRFTNSLEERKSTGKVVLLLN
jgi:hypothetical protein